MAEKKQKYGNIKVQGKDREYRIWENKLYCIEL